MTLEEKLDKAIDGTGSSVVNRCEKIAEDFAIGFAEWVNFRTVQITKSEWGNWLPNAQVNLSTKELLEIYKKENGL